ncbi:MAG: phosphate acetyltransferase [Candidatus Omnitrophica bacterium]|nr:phosphate acetyltransferase [Candidatus Omnitrophota bacterium]
MTRIESIWERAKKKQARIVLPEGNDLRVVEAACVISAEKIAAITLLGDPGAIEAGCRKNGWKLDGVNVVDPVKHPRYEEIVQTCYELRKHKGITPDDARKLVLEKPVYYASLMTRLDLADGFVGGACHTTADVAKAALYFTRLDRSIGVLSSCFVIELENCPFGENGFFIFGDCGVIPDPSSNQLAGIAVACGQLLETLFDDIKARVALLSYSTKGSAEGPSIDKVRKALPLIQEKAPGLMIDGELQGDAALIPEVAAIKCKGSSVAGRANVLIFPNLDAGNICYKLIQRLGKARVIGPILLGVMKPASDLSRGCGVEEVVDAVAVTAVRAGKASTAKS